MAKSYKDCLASLSKEELESLDDAILKDISDRAQQPGSNTVAAIAEILNQEEIDRGLFRKVVIEALEKKKAGKALLKTAGKVGVQNKKKLELLEKRKKRVQKRKEARAKIAEKAAEKKAAESTVHGIKKVKRVGEDQDGEIGNGLLVQETTDSLKGIRITGIIKTIDGMEVLIHATVEDGNTIWHVLEPNTGMWFGKKPNNFGSLAEAETYAAAEIAKDGGGKVVSKNIQELIDAGLIPKVGKSILKTDVDSGIQEITGIVTQVTHKKSQNETIKKEKPQPTDSKEGKKEPSSRPSESKGAATEKKASKPEPKAKDTRGGRKAERLGDQPSIAEVNDELLAKPLHEFSNHVLRGMITKRATRILDGDVVADYLIITMLGEIDTLTAELESRDNGKTPLSAKQIADLKIVEAQVQGVEESPENVALDSGLQEHLDRFQDTSDPAVTEVSAEPATKSASPKTDSSKKASNRSVRTRTVGGVEVPSTLDDEAGDRVEAALLKQQGKDSMPTVREFLRSTKNITDIDSRIRVMRDLGLIPKDESQTRALIRIYHFVLKYEVNSLASTLPVDAATALSDSSEAGVNRMIARRIAGSIPGAKALNLKMPDKFGRNIWVVYLEMGLGSETALTSEDIEKMAAESGIEPGTMSRFIFGSFDGLPSEILKVLTRALRDGRDKNPKTTDKSTSGVIMVQPKTSKSQIRVDAGQLRALGRVVDEQTGDSTLSSSARMSRQFLAGLAYFLDTFDVKLASPLSDELVIHPSNKSGSGLTYGDVRQQGGEKPYRKTAKFLEKLLNQLKQLRKAIARDPTKADVVLPILQVQQLLTEAEALEKQFDQKTLKGQKEEIGAAIGRLQAIHDEAVKIKSDLHEPVGTPVAESGLKAIEGENAEALEDFKVQASTTQTTVDEDIEAGEVESHLNRLSDAAEEVGHMLTDTEAAQQRLSIQGNKSSPRRARRDTQKDLLNRRQVEGKNNFFVELAQSVLDALGIRTQVDILSRQEAVIEIRKLKEELSTTHNEDRKGVLTRRIQGLSWLIQRKDSAIYAFDDEVNAIDRIPVILIDSASANPLVQLLHELGHLVEYSALRNAPTEVIVELRAAFEKTGMEESMFSEWFADQLQLWVTRRGLVVQNKGLRAFFDQLIKMLKQVFELVAPGTYSTFEAFLDGLHQTGGKAEAIMPRTKLGGQFIKALEGRTIDFFVPYSPDPTKADFTPAVKQRAQKMLGWSKTLINSTFVKRTQEAVSSLMDVTARTADAYLRNIGIPEFADHFHLRPDVKGENRKETIFQEMRIEAGKWQNKMRVVNNLYPRVKRWYAPRHGIVDRQSTTYLAVQDALMMQTPLNEIKGERIKSIVKATRTYYREFHGFLTANGMSLGYQADYVPMMVDTMKWADNKEEILKRLMSIGYTKAEAEQSYHSVQQSRGETADGGIKENVLTGPSFASARHRFYGPKEHRVLKDFYRSDIPSVTLDYTHNAIKRMIVQRRFGEVVRTETIVVDGKDVEVDVIDPIRKLEKELMLALQSNKITPAQYERIRGLVMPAYFGRLGSSMSEPLRRLSSFMIVYQNIRLLALAVLPSMVDPLHVLLRSRGLSNRWQDLRSAIHAMKTKDELYDTAEFLGFIRDDLTEAALNDPVEAQFFSPNTRAINEWFFRANGLHQLTQFSRVFGLIVGKRYISDYAYKARDGDKKALDILRELGLDYLDVIRWDRSGRPMDLAGNRRVIGALHQFVDESIMRPDSTIRPVWGSDQRLQIFFHLKSFIFSYHETIWRRVYSDMKAQGFSPKAAIPLISLVALVLPMSMAMYELRRRINYWGEAPEHLQEEAPGFVWESMQRSGMLGMFQFAVDAESAEGRGQMAIWALAGPTAAQFQEFVTKDFGAFALRAMPLVAQSSALRGVVTSSFSD